MAAMSHDAQLNKKDFPMMIKTSEPSGNKKFELREESKSN
jgi:hypothetical protein